MTEDDLNEEVPAQPHSTKFYPGTDIYCSESLSINIETQRRVWGAFFFQVQLASKADAVRTTAAKALMDATINDDDYRRYEETIAQPNIISDQLKAYSVINSQNLTNNIVAAFQRYLSSIIQDVATVRPEILRSSQTMRIDEILNTNSHEELIAYIIDKKINELAYGGLREIERYLSDRLNVPMFDDENTKSLLTLFIEARNINVHNGGIVNDMFLKKVGEVKGFVFRKNDVFGLDFDMLTMLSENALNVALRLDQKIAEKFGIQRKLVEEWHKT